MVYFSLPFLILVVSLLLGCWVIPKRLQQWSITIISVGFLFWFSPKALLLLGILSTITFWQLKINRKGWAVIVQIGLITTIIVWFKHDMPISRNTNELLATFGLSYYSLRLIHYSIEQWKNNLPNHNFAQFIHYMFFFPTFQAGPINRFPEFIKSSRRRRWDNHKFSQGLERILYGYVKIVVIGNYLISIKLDSYAEQLFYSNQPLSIYLGCFSYGANLYFQFAGYSDIAIGLSLLLGYDIIENFNYPFLARNINDFWTRWHISLSSWCRDYIYMPVLSMSRTPQLAVFSSMIILGLWHEFSWRYLAWGAYHGIGIAILQSWSKLVKQKDWNLSSGTILFFKVLAWLLTFNFVILSFAITKSENIPEALTALALLFGKQ